MPQPRRHLDFFALQEALAQPGCPACRLGRRAAQRFFETLLHEHVNDPVVREQLRQAGGFCQEHTKMLLGLGDALGCSLLYADLLAAAAATMPPPMPIKACPACQAQEQGILRALETLAAHWGAADLWDAYEKSDGLCWPHLARLQQLKKAATAFPSLFEIERERLRRLAAECAVFVAQSDYQRQAESPRAAGNAWQRAARKLAGGIPDDA